MRPFLAVMTALILLSLNATWYEMLVSKKRANQASKSPLPMQIGMEVSLCKEQEVLDSMQAGLVTTLAQAPLHSTVIPVANAVGGIIVMIVMIVKKYI